MSVGNDLPCSWASTANALEHTAFAAKDAVLVVDDWVPATRQGSEAEMDRLLRGQGNGSGRARLGQASYYPRGLIISTGEASPKGRSLVARMIVLQMGDRLDWDRLSLLQQQGRDGVHASCLAGFVGWLAPRLPEIQAWSSERVHQVRPKFEIDGLHRRTSDAISNLEAAFAVFLKFTVDVGALDRDAADAFLDAAHDRLVRCALDQLHVQQDSDPARLFLARLRSPLESGQLLLADLDGDAPGRSEENCVGWTKGPKAYLDPAKALAAAQILGDPCEALAISESQLGAALHRSDLLARVDTRGEKVRTKVRLMVCGNRRQVWALHLASVTSVAHSRHRQLPTRCLAIQWDEPCATQNGAGASSTAACGHDGTSGPPVALSSGWPT